MAFDNVEFPLTVARLGASPEFRTTVLEYANGQETRTALWEDARIRFDAGPGVRTTTDLHTLITFFRARKGRARGFYVKDYTDFRVTNEGLGVIGGGGSTLQLTRTYTDAGNSDVREITKPKQGTLALRANGGTLTEGVHYSVNYQTGVITMLTGGQNGAVSSADFEFYVPVRFGEDRLNVDLLHYRITEGYGEIPEIPLIEIRDFQ